MIIQTPQGTLEYALAADEAQIIDIFIKPEFRRQGYAEKLLREWLLKLQSNSGVNPAVAYIILEVRANNIAAINLYHKLGFKDLNIRKDYYQNPLENAIVMRLTIIQEQPAVAADLQ